MEYLVTVAELGLSLLLIVFSVVVFEAWRRRHSNLYVFRFVSWLLSLFSYPDSEFWDLFVFGFSQFCRDCVYTRGSEILKTGIVLIHYRF